MNSKARIRPSWAGFLQRQLRGRRFEEVQSRHMLHLKATPPTPLRNEMATIRCVNMQLMNPAMMNGGHETNLYKDI
jgi:hypothetical protein